MWKTYGLSWDYVTPSHNLASILSDLLHCLTENFRKIIRLSLLPEQKELEPTKIFQGKRASQPV